MVKPRPLHDVHGLVAPGLPPNLREKMTQLETQTFFCFLKRAMNILPFASAANDRTLELNLFRLAVVQVFQSNP